MYHQKSNVLKSCRAAFRTLQSVHHAIRTQMLGRTKAWRVIKGQFEMSIDPTDYMDRKFYLGTYSQPLIRLIDTIVRPGDVCVDVGAQKGYITLHLANAVGRMGHVLAFEPDPRAMKVMYGNVRRNNFEQVSLYDCGLGNGDGVCEFALSSQLGWSSRFPNEIAKATVASTTRITVRPLDEIVAEANIAPQTHRLSFIKIDAEGSEPLILEGAQKTLKNFSPLLHIEINRASLRAGNFSVSAIDVLLDALDYDLYAIAFRRSGWRQKRSVSLSSMASLESEVHDCQDILAVPKHSDASDLLQLLISPTND